MREAPKVKVTEEQDVGWFTQLSYAPFRWFDNKPHAGILKLLYKADIQMLPGMFLGSLITTALLASITAFVGSWLTFTFLVKTPASSLLELVVTAAALAGSLGALPLITLNRITAKRVKIDSVMPFALAYMAALSSAGMNPVETINLVGLKDFGPVSREFQKIAYRTQILGEDINSAMSFVARNTPSETLHDILVGISNLITSGGSLRTYCEQESHELFEIKKAKLKGFIDSLAAFSEGYIGGIIVGVVMGLVGIVVMGALGLHLLSLSTGGLLEIFIFLLVPLLNVAYLGILEMRFSSGEF